MHRLLPTALAVVLLLLSCTTCVAKLNRIITVGDLHGDMAQTINILQATGIVSYQPDYYRDKISQDARDLIAESAAVGAKASHKHKKTERAELGLDTDHINGAMIFNKRGHLMQGKRADVYHWAGGKAALIILGDAMNSGPDDFDVVFFLQRLEGEAADAGGKVVLLLGNHEVQNLMGNYMGVHPWSFERSGGRVGRTAALSEKQPLGRYLRSRPVLHQEDDLIFMHGGIVPGTVKFLKKNLPHFRNDTFVGEVNKRVRKTLESLTYTDEGVPVDRVRDPVARLVLDYEYAENKDEERNPILVHPLDKCEEILKANKMMGIPAQVVGHTPHDTPTYRFCNGSLLAIDFKMSQWKGGQGSALAALQLIRAPARHNHTNGVAEGDWTWHSTLIIPPTPNMAQPENVSGAQRWQSWKTFFASVILAVAAIEFVLAYRRRRNASRE
jgi:hypothetical protein